MDPLQSQILRQSLIRKTIGQPLPAHTPRQILDQQIQNEIESKLPGCAIPFNKLIASDSIECDPLIAQGNLTILRLDELFRDVYEVWLKSTQNPVALAQKRVTSCGAKTPDEKPQKKTELTTKSAQPDPAMVNQAVNILLASIRVQATITHRRDYLKNPELAQTLDRRASEGQPAKRNKKTKPSESNPDAPIRGVQPLRCVSYHPQFTGFYEKGEKEWPFFIPPGMDDEDGDEDAHNEDTGALDIEDAYKVPDGLYYDDELEDEGATEPELPTYPEPKEFPLYSRPPFPNEKTHYYPPFAPASPKDAEEIDAYLASLPPEVTKEKKNIAILMNEYLVPPVWREPETELEHKLKHRRLKRAHQKQARQERRAFHKRE